MTGTDESDPLVLQVKEAGPSCFERYTGSSRYIEHGRRKDYYVRQLWDEKGSVDLDSISVSDLDGYAALCARTLAHAHAKTGNRHEIAGYVGKGDAFASAMTAFASSYADQNEEDYKVFLKQLGKSGETGRIE